jgi:hypothetical protein
MKNEQKVPTIKEWLKNIDQRLEVINAQLTILQEDIDKNTIEIESELNKFTVQKRNCRFFECVRNWLKL